MFSSKNRDSSDIAIPTAAPAPPVGKRTGRSSAPSIISSDLTVRGTLFSAGDIQIDGRVEGDVQSAGLVIGEKAIVQGEVLAEEVTIRGRVEGSIRARKVLLCASCHVEGNILHEAFAVESGAFFEGNCRHSDNPLADDAGRSKPADFKSAVSSSGTPQVAKPEPPRPLAAAAPLKSGT
jgi:cytoskeletal protein CcmA (bactofilin family)